MTPELRLTLLAEAETLRDAARSRFNTSRIGSRAWKEAEEDLDWWIGRVAFLSNPQIEVRA